MLSCLGADTEQMGCFFTDRAFGREVKWTKVRNNEFEVILK